MKGSLLFEVGDAPNQSDDLINPLMGSTSEKKERTVKGPGKYLCESLRF